MLGTMGKLSLLLLFILVFRFIEAAKASRGPTQRRRFYQEIDVLYHALYLHLSLGMAALGLVWDRSDSGIGSMKMLSCILIVIVLTLVGVIFRGLGSDHAPEVISFRDADWRDGVVIPNILGFAALLFTIIAT